MSLKKRYGANLSFEMKRKTIYQVQPLSIAPSEEEPVVVIETTEVVIEEPATTTETKEGNWKAKRDKKKIPYGLKEDPTSDLE